LAQEAPSCQVLVALVRFVDSAIASSDATMGTGSAPSMEARYQVCAEGHNNETEPLNVGDEPDELSNPVAGFPVRVTGMLLCSLGLIVCIAISEGSSGTAPTEPPGRVSFRTMMQVAPMAANQRIMCSCPPSPVEWECNKDERDDITSGKTCGYFAEARSHDGESHQRTNDETHQQMNAVIQAAGGVGSEDNGLTTDVDELRILRAKAKYLACRDDVLARQKQGENIAEAICDQHLEQAHSECVASVKRRQAQGENLAVEICDMAE